MKENSEKGFAGKISDIKVLPIICFSSFHAIEWAFAVKFFNFNLYFLLDNPSS